MRSAHREFNVISIAEYKYVDLYFHIRDYANDWLISKTEELVQLLAYEHTVLKPYIYPFIDPPDPRNIKMVVWLINYLTQLGLKSNNGDPTSFLALLCYPRMDTFAEGGTWDLDMSDTNPNIELVRHNLEAIKNLKLTTKRQTIYT